MSDQTANLEVMTQAARAASRSLLRDFLEVDNLQSSRKGASDFVSKADIFAEKIIRERLMEARPNYGWIGEESEKAEGSDPTRYWIVDPLDGTTNFLHGLPHWAISIALESKGEIVAGVVFDPVKNEMFTASKGGGAWLNDRRIRVSGRTDLSEMLFATGLPFNGRGNGGAPLKEVARVLPVCAGRRRNGAAALDLAYVAAGRFDGFWEENLNSWDMAAGEILIREAGGYVESYSGDKHAYQHGDIITAAPDILPLLRKLVQD